VHLDMNSEGYTVEISTRGSLRVRPSLCKISGYVMIRLAAAAMGAGLAVPTAEVRAEDWEVDLLFSYESPNPKATLTEINTLAAHRDSGSLDGLWLTGLMNVPKQGSTLFVQKVDGMTGVDLWNYTEPGSSYRFLISNVVEYMPGSEYLYTCKSAVAQQQSTVDPLFGSGSSYMFNPTDTCGTEMTATVKCAGVLSSGNMTGYMVLGPGGSKANQNSRLGDGEPPDPCRPSWGCPGLPCEVWDPDQLTISQIIDRYVRDNETNTFYTVNDVNGKREVWSINNIFLPNTGQQATLEFTMPTGVNIAAVEINNPPGLEVNLLMADRGLANKIHIARSTDDGQTWSMEDLVILADVPGVAGSIRNLAAWPLDGPIESLFITTFDGGTIRVYRLIPLEFEGTDLGPEECDPQPNCEIGFPINVGNGNAYVQHTDFSLPAAKGMPLMVSRTYNSQASLADAGYFGVFWSSTLDPFFAINGNQIAIRNEVGMKEYYNLNMGTGFFEPAAPANLHARIKLEGGFYVKADTAGTRWFFDANPPHKLLRKEDRNEQGLDFTYDMGNPDQLTQVQDAHGKTITITWMSVGGFDVIDAINYPGGRVVDYDYDASAHLIKVDYPESFFLEYNYEAPGFTDLLTSVNDPNGPVNGVLERFEYDTTVFPPRATVSAGKGNAWRKDVDYTTHTITSASNGAAANFVVQTSGGRPRLKQLTGAYDPGKGLLQNAAYDSDLNRTSSLTLEGILQEAVYDSLGGIMSLTEDSGGMDRNSSFTWTDPIPPGWTHSLHLLDQRHEPSAGGVAMDERVIDYGYDSNGNLTSIEVTGFGHNGLPGSTTHTVTMQYNSAGQLTQIDGPRVEKLEDITGFAYDGTGYLMSVTPPHGGTTTFATDSVTGRRTDITTPDGVQVHIEYDGLDRVVEVQEIGVGGSPTRTTEYMYDANGDLVTVVLPQELAQPARMVQYSYEPGTHRLLSITSPDLEKVESTYDGEGNKVQEDYKDAGGVIKGQVGFAYDTRNRLIRKCFDAGVASCQTAPPAGTFEAYSYDGDDRLMALTDQRGIVTQFNYDNLNRLEQRIENLMGAGVEQAQTQYSYNLGNVLTEVLDPIGVATQYSWSDFGNLTSESSVDTGMSSYQHDEAGNLTQVSDSDPELGPISYTYDAANRLVTIDGPGTDVDVSYMYGSSAGQSSFGRIVTIEDGSLSGGGTVERSYDALGRLMTEQWNGQTTSYAWGQNNQPSTMTYPSGNPYSYSYDLSGRMATITQGTMMPPTVVDGISYRPFGPPETIGRPGLRADQAMEYDGRYRMGSNEAAGIFSESYVWDEANRLTSRSGTEAYSYGYDSPEGWHGWPKAAHGRATRGK